MPSVQEIFIQIIENKFYTIYPWLVLFAFNISESRSVAKKITTDFTMTSKLFINKPIRKYIAIFLYKSRNDIITKIFTAYI